MFLLHAAAVARYVMSFCSSVFSFLFQKKGCHAVVELLILKSVQFAADAVNADDAADAVAAALSPDSYSFKYRCFV